MNRFNIFLAVVALAGCSDENETGSDAGDTSMGDASMGDMAMGDMAMGDTAGDDAITATSGSTDAGTFYVSYEIDGSPTVGTTFSMTVSVFESDETTPVDDATLALEESMPGMGHGMDTEPEITANGDGTFSVTNLAYTMAGTWRYDFTITAGDRSDTIAFAVECCE